MLEEAIYKFRTTGPMLLPEVIDNFWLGDIKMYEDYAILPYEVHNPQSLDRIIEMFDENADLTILYHLIPSISTVFGHECCGRKSAVFGITHRKDAMGSSPISS